MITLLLFKSLELYFVFNYQKKICWKNIGFKKISKNRFWPSPVDRAVDCWQSKTALSVDRAIDRHAPSANVHFSRPDRSTGCKSSALCLVRSTGPVDRQRVSISIWEPPLFPTI